jgi:pimeloyl-ACP methyl ester carboxylesterase
MRSPFDSAKLVNFGMRTLDKHTYSMYVFAMTTDHVSADLATVDLPQGRLAYRTAGPATSDHPPILLVHGLLVDARLWEPVAERLARAGIRSYTPTLPLGSHRHPMNADADLSPEGVARLVLDFIRALGLSDVTIAGNDTGGAICQIMLAGDTSRISAAVLTNCDALGTFPPRSLAPLLRALRHPGVVACMAPALRSKAMRNGPLAYGPLSSEPLDSDLTLSWVKPLADEAVRRDLAKLARGVHPRVLLDAASRFDQFTGSVRVLWGEADSMFRLTLGRQLAEAFPHATFATVPGGRAFLPLDHPDRVADEIISVAREARSAG